MRQRPERSIESIGFPSYIYRLFFRHYVESKNHQHFHHARRVELTQKTGIHKKTSYKYIQLYTFPMCYSYFFAKGPLFGDLFFVGILLDPWIYEAPAFFGCFLVPPVKGYGEGMAVAGPVSGWFQTVARDEADAWGLLGKMILDGMDFVRQVHIIWEALIFCLIFRFVINTYKYIGQKKSLSEFLLLQRFKVDVFTPMILVDAAAISIDGQWLVVKMMF